MPPRRPRVPKNAERPGASRPKSAHATPQVSPETPAEDLSGLADDADIADGGGNTEGSGLRDQRVQRDQQDEQLTRQHSGQESAKLSDPSDPPKPSKPSKPPKPSTSKRTAARREVLGRANREKTTGKNTGKKNASQKARPQRASSTAQRTKRHEKPPRGTSATDAESREPTPARSFSGRTVVLLIVVFVAAIVIAPTLRVFLTQQAEIAEIQEDIEAQTERRDELTEQLARWDDPAYVQQQARERFNMVMPGEKKYMVIGGEAEADQNEEAVEVDAEPEESAWAQDLWESLIVSAHS